MRRLLKGDAWMFIVGAVLLLWGATSAFSDQMYIQQLIRSSSDGVVVTPDAPLIGLAPHSLPGGASNGALPSRGPAKSSTAEPSISPTDSSGEDVILPQVLPTAPQATPLPALPPDRLVIPAIKLDAPIVQVVARYMKFDNVLGVFEQWTVPDEFAAGWLPQSAPIGVPGNTVLDGHHNEWGEVFGHLIDLKPGEKIIVYSGKTAREYVIANKMILPERDEPMSVRLANAQWLLPSSDERLTLVTCWPHWTNTHRLIIVAEPIGWLVPPS